MCMMAPRSATPRGRAWRLAQVAEGMLLVGGPVRSCCPPFPAPPALASSGDERAAGRRGRAEGFPAFFGAVFQLGPLCPHAARSSRPTTHASCTQARARSGITPAPRCNAT